MAYSPVGLPRQESWCARTWLREAPFTQDGAGRTCVIARGRVASTSPTPVATRGCGCVRRIRSHLVSRETGGLGRQRGRQASARQHRERRASAVGCAACGEFRQSREGCCTEPDCAQAPRVVRVSLSGSSGEFEGGIGVVHCRRQAARCLSDTLLESFSGLMSESARWCRSHGTRGVGSQGRLRGNGLRCAEELTGPSRILGACE